MPRKTIQKNLAYDTERQLYYAVFRQDGRRYTRTYRTRAEAQAALEGNSCADRRLPGKDCTLGEWLTFWLECPAARRLGITGLQDLQQVLRRAWERRRSDDPKEWVVLRQDGTPPKPDQLTRDLLTVVRRQGLPKISLHGLRHSFASVANSQGVPMFDISRTLGHSSMTVTSNIYTHLFDDTEAQALAAVARAIEKA